MSADIELSEAKRRILERMLQGDGALPDCRPEVVLPRLPGARVPAEPAACGSTARPAREGWSSQINPARFVRQLMGAGRSRSPEGVPPVQLSPPRVRQARFEDYQQTHRLESAYFPDSLPAGDRRGLLVDNPLWSRLGSNWPIGWVLEDSAGRIVGSLNNVPSLYRFRGEERVCANGHCWAALAEYRGYAPMLMGEYFGQDGAELFISSKVGADATPIWATHATRVPAGDWGTAAYMVTQHRGFARKALEMKHAPLAGVLAAPAAAILQLKDAVASRAIPAAASSVEFAKADGFDSRFDAFWQELLHQSPGRLLAVRDRQALCWHFAIPMRAKRLWVLTALRNNLLRAHCVLRQHTRPQGLRSVKLVDYRTLERGEELLAGLFRATLRRCAAEGNHILEHHGCGLKRMRVFDEIAPYRAKKPAWSFYYHAADAALGIELDDPEVWDPSEFDGDASYKQLPSAAMTFAVQGPCDAVGAYEVRDAARALDLEVLLLGAELEGVWFWDGVRTCRPDPSAGPHGWLRDVMAAVQPALVEEQPRRLLAARAAGVLATAACGLDGPGVTCIAPLDPASLTDRLRRMLPLDAAS